MPGIAADLLESGLDSPSLRRLAGESQAACSADVEPLVRKVMRELGIPYPMPEEQVQLIFASQLARKVIDGREPWPAAYDLECIIGPHRPAKGELVSIFASNDEWSWNADHQRYVPVGASDLIETFARLGSVSDAEIFSAR